MDRPPGATRARCASSVDLSFTRTAGAVGAPPQCAHGSSRRARDRDLMECRSLGMALLLSNHALQQRAAVAANELAPLADGLAAELEPLADREIYIPREKALLSREGGRCPRDGATLE